mgnify:CR=1 FL=1
MKLVHAATMSTGLILVLGIAMVAPVYIRIPDRPREQLTVMLLFSVVNSENAGAWCSNLSSFLKDKNLMATVFIAGKVAERNPECIRSFPKCVDIGSQTYSYVNITSISDYLAQLEEVKKGKEAVDKAGNLDSRLFRAPYGATDENIYSLLNRSGIVADFSYEKQYNKYHDGQFMKFNLTTYRGVEHPAEFFLYLSQTGETIAIIFDDSTPINDIKSLVAILFGRVRFANASEVTGLELTIRGR